MTDRIRVLIADDHPVYRDGLRALVESAPDLDLAGEATTGSEAVDLAAAGRPAVILMDLRMPVLSGIEATRRILEADPTVGILIVTMSEDDESLFAAMRAGARGYIPKDAERAEILSAIRAVALGEAVFGASIARRVADFFAAPRSPAAEPFPDLTDRENEILELIAQGRSNGEIAGRLEIAPKTVRNHVANVFNKLQVADRAHAIVRAREAGLGRDSSRRSD
jgi:DNA-binding NarL/FixJ family response regulator